MKRHKLFYGSAYDRGLEVLLDFWPRIRQRHPDATIDVAYGWDSYLAWFRNDPERIAWMRDIEMQLQQPGITHHARVSKNALCAIRRSCGIWAYPCRFFEIHCITALEAQADGCVPCVIECGALGESVQCGVKVQGNGYDTSVQEIFLEELLSLMDDEERWRIEREKGQAFARGLNWQRTAAEWTSHF